MEILFVFLGTSMFLSTFGPVIYNRFANTNDF
jgi:hypothetical protein